MRFRSTIARVIAVAGVVLSLVATSFALAPAVSAASSGYECRSDGGAVTVQAPGQKSFQLRRNGVWIKAVNGVNLDDNTVDYTDPGYSNGDAYNAILWIRGVKNEIPCQDNPTTGPPPTTTPPTTAPPAQFDCDVMPTASGFMVNWGGVTGAADYVVRRSVDGGGDFWRGRVDAPGVKFNDGPLPAGKTSVVYAVQARSGSRQVISETTCGSTPPPTTVPELVCVPGSARWDAADPHELRFLAQLHPSRFGAGLTKEELVAALDLSEVFEAMDQYGDYEYHQVVNDTNNSFANVFVSYSRTTLLGDLPTQLTFDIVVDGAGTAGRSYSACFDIAIGNIVSPVGLDIDGSGSVERVSAEIDFDFAGNGDLQTVSEWFAPTEGILFDSRIDGLISGAHLFGDQGGLYSDGFEKLALLDSNSDGQISGVELNGLAIWIDANTNGVLDQGEQSSLNSHGVVSLSTSHTNMVSSAILVDGSTMVTEDIWFGTTTALGTSDLRFVLGAGGAVALAGLIMVRRRREDDLDDELAELTRESIVS